MAATADYLTESANALDQINVYPVPDNDTGSNMALTLRGACDQALTLKTPAGIDQVLTALAQGALYSGRGNSGVILSQALSGLAKSAAGKKQVGGLELTHGLQVAVTAAYTAVVKPVEGTMLTVLRAAANGAETTNSRDVLAVLEAALTAAEMATIKTIDQLPALSQAGVTDAGGEGVCAILRGLVANLRDDIPAPVIMATWPTATKPKSIAGGLDYCTVFLLVPQKEQAVDVEGLRRYLSQGEFGSVVIAGDQRALRVHAHTNAPKLIFEEAKKFGDIARSSYERINDRG